MKLERRCSNDPEVDRSDTFGSDGIDRLDVSENDWLDLGRLIGEEFHVDQFSWAVNDRGRLTLVGAYEDWVRNVSIRGRDDAAAVCMLARAKRRS